MEYKDRKLCGLINAHVVTKRFRCPLDNDKSRRDVACDGCALFETYLKFKGKAMEQLREISNG